MKEMLTEKEIDRIAGAVVRGFSLDAAELDSIADSVKLRRDVRVAVAELNAQPGRRGWIFGFGWMTPVFGAILLGVCLGAVALTMMLRTVDTPIVSIPQAEAGNHDETAVAINPAFAAEVAPSDIDSPEIATPKVRLTKTPGASESQKNRIAATKSKVRPRVTTRVEGPDSDSKEERLTDFIALSYADKSESGQILRVKVPSAMMVTLGVVSEVRNSAELVSADVVVGDDGLARAIRFVK